ncbi:MAG TPA: 50S ribosomal protein L30 [Prolixibacteraceae bacterium]|nr:50S ribosomal protein L30 [Prolixibacteraceae bacterium]
MAKIRITLKKSSIGSTQRQKLTLEALGLRKLNHTVEKEATPQIMGMVNKLTHLVQVEEIVTDKKK